MRFLMFDRDLFTLLSNATNKGMYQLQRFSVQFFFKIGQL